MAKGECQGYEIWKGDKREPREAKWLLPKACGHLVTSAMKYLGYILPRRKKVDTD